MRIAQIFFIALSAVDAQAQLLPQDQQRTFRLPEGFQIELVAAEPDTPKPITLAFDAAGRLWTMTAVEYPVDANEEPRRAKALFEKGGRDRVLVLDTPTAAGRQTPRVFAEGLAIPLGLLPYREGAFVQYGSEILFLRDSDGDGRADQREIILRGFGIQDSHLFPHGFTRAPGGWIYMAQGAFNSGRVQDRSGRLTEFRFCKLARFRPDGSRFEIVGWGLNNIWGFVISREGEMFVQEANDLGYPVAPFFVGASYPGIGGDRAKPYAPWQPPSTAEFHMGGTGLSGLAFSDGGDSFPPPWREVMFVANPITSKIQAIRMHPDGAHWRLEKLPDFLTSADPWFRPVHIQFGPDGCLYIVDWYNKIISHNEVPRNHPERDKTRGRIWRVRHRDSLRREIPDLTRVADADLLRHLAADNTWECTAAWQQIVDRQAVTLAPRLRALAESPRQAADLRLRALWALEGLGRAELPTLKRLAAEKNRNLRREAVRVVAAQNFSAKKIAEFVVPLADDPDPQVRAEVIRALDSAGEASSLSLLIRMAKPPLDAPILRTPQDNLPAVAGAAHDRAFERFLIRAALEKRREDLETFLDRAASKKLPVENRLFAALALGEGAPARILARALPDLKRPPNDEEWIALAAATREPEVAAAFAALLKKPDALQRLLPLAARISNREAAVIIAAAARAQPDKDLLISLAAAYQLKELEEDVVALARSESGSLQVAAVRALRELGSARIELFQQLAAQGNGDLRQEAAVALASARDERVLPATLELWPTLSAPVRRAVLERLAGSKWKAKGLVQALRRGAVASGDVDAAVWEKLRAVLGNDPELAALMRPNTAETFPALRLHGGGADFADAGVTLDGAFTVECWVKLDAGISNADGILGRGGDADLNFHDARLRVYGGATHGDRIIARTPISPEVWTHVAVTRDAQGRFKIYLNGELDTAECNPLAARFENLAVGRTTPADGTAGWIAEFRVWNVERSAEQICDNYTAAVASDAPGLVWCSSRDGWGRLSGRAETRVPDEPPPMLLGEEAALMRQKFEKYRALVNHGGDAGRGKAWFDRLCLSCHTIGGRGGAVGPPLDGLGLKDGESLLRNLLTPNAGVEAGFRLFRVHLNDDEVVDGVKVAEDELAVVLRQPNAGDQRIPRSRIARAYFTSRSMMPEGLLESLSDLEAADLLAYLRALK